MSKRKTLAVPKEVVRTFTRTSMIYEQGIANGKTKVADLRKKMNKEKSQSKRLKLRGEILRTTQGIRALENQKKTMERWFKRTQERLAKK